MVSAAYLDGVAPPGDQPLSQPIVGSGATWNIEPDQRISQDSTGFPALVTRIGCNNGVIGKVNEPRLQMSKTEVIDTFTVSPEQPGAADCPGNSAEPYEVKLKEPVGDRRLVDGACLPGGEAIATSSATDGDGSLLNASRTWDRLGMSAFPSGGSKSAQP